MPESAISLLKDRIHQFMAIKEPEKTPELHISMTSEQEMLISVGKATDKQVSLKFPAPLRLGHVFDRLGTELSAKKPPRLSQAIEKNGWRLDPVGLLLTFPISKEGLDQHTAELTEREYDLCYFLLDALPAPVSKNVLIQNIWQFHPDVESHTLETHIYRLRQKIEPDPSQPVYLVKSEDGYRLAGP